MRKKRTQAQRDKKARMVGRFAWIPQTKKIDGKRYKRGTIVYVDRLEAMKKAEKKREKGFSARLDALINKKDPREKLYIVWFRKK